MRFNLLKGMIVVGLMTSSTFSQAANNVPLILAQAKTVEKIEDSDKEAAKEVRRAARKAKRKKAKALQKKRAAAAKAAKAKKAAAVKAEQPKRKKAPGAEVAKPTETRAQRRVRLQAERKTKRKKAKIAARKRNQARVAAKKKARLEARRKAAAAERAKALSSGKPETKAERRARRKAERRAARAKAAKEEANAKPVDKKAATAATVDGTDPTKRAPAVVKDKLTKKQKANLKAAERARRRAKRRERRKLLGAAAAGAVVGVVINELGGRVVEDQGDRIVVERDGRYLVRKDENELFRRRGTKVFDEAMPNGNLRTTVVRPNGSRVVTVRDPGGTIIRRVKVRRNGDRIVLIDTRRERASQRRNFRRELGALRHRIARDEYIVETRRADRRAIRKAFVAKPVERVERQYTLNEVRQSSRLREKMRRVDLDTITFESGSFSLTQSQVSDLTVVADAIQNVIDDNPREIFLIEGHTDAVGGEVSNLTLSDRRAETVAQILTGVFDLPPENFVVQGYGETNLKIDTLGNERRNRRVTVRRITPLINTASR